MWWVGDAGNQVGGCSWLADSNKKIVSMTVHLSMS